MLHDRVRCIWQYRSCLSVSTVDISYIQSSEFIQYLTEVGEGVGITVRSSSRADLPPASLKRFLSEGIDDLNADFSGSVLTGFDNKFRNTYAA